MKQSVNFTIFVDAFHKHNRYEQFGYSALRVIFDYLEDFEAIIGEELELDVIAICCDYSVDAWQDIAANYSIDVSEYEEEDEKEEHVRNYLQDHTQVLGETDDGQIVYQVF